MLHACMYRHNLLSECLLLMYYLKKTMNVSKVSKRVKIGCIDKNALNGIKRVPNVLTYIGSRVYYYRGEAHRYTLH